MARSFRRIPDTYRATGDATDGESDSSLIERAKRGDQRAFADLDRRYRDKLKAFLGKKYELDPYESEDIAQRAFLKAWRYLPKFRGDCTFWTLLLRHVGPSIAKDYFRAQAANRNAKRQAIVDNEFRESIGEDILDNEGTTAKYETDVQLPESCHGLITYWMGQKPIRIRGSKKPTRWHGIDPEPLRKALADLRTKNVARPEKEWMDLTNYFADVLVKLCPGRGRRPTHSSLMMRTYFLLTAMQSARTPKGQAMFLAGFLTGLLPALKMGRPPKGGCTPEMVLGLVPRRRESITRTN